MILASFYTLLRGLAHEHAVLQEIETPSTLSAEDRPAALSSDGSGEE